MSANNPGFVRRTWRALRRPSVKWSVLTLLLIGFFGGIIFWGGFNTGMEATNRLEFCISCHEMRDNVYQEYKQTIHYSNRTGVRAICSDCHVPHDWTPKIIRKIQASRELWGKLTGYIDTKEKFESHRMELATREWARMKSVDSRECRNCHSFDAMSADKQRQSVYTKHMKAKADGQTCIDCHKGIAHHLPKEYRDPDEE
ncbi:MAG TPA: NapC/NirT family cytochrome c [Rudaea sp.]|jgi:cytochrome c-type protein NapC|nr:NapC/NirT family cytochrome c [Rudaea sp.]